MATEAAPTRRRTPRRAWVVWGVGLLAYVVAVFHRASLSVAGVEAQERFGITAGVLSLFVVLQLAVYAAMQVPVGALLDRFGSRRIIVTGAALMVVAQVALALAETVTLAVAARVLVGIGDAMTFTSVLRVVALWFPGRIAPLLTQLTGILGQLGQVLATVPLVALLAAVGWTTSFLGAAAVGTLVGVLVLVALQDAPEGEEPPRMVSLAQVREALVGSWREPGTRTGLWTHFTTQFSGNTFVLLWGYPFLVVGQGLAPTTAGLLLSLLVGASMVVGPLLGQLTSRWPLRRAALAFTIIGSSAAVWTVVLLWPGTTPFWLLVVLVLVLSTNGPGSMLGFDYARSANPPARIGSASGIVNAGGFVASLLLAGAIGLTLDLLTPGSSTDYSLDAFRAAFATQYVLWGVGTALLVRDRRRLRAQFHARTGELPDPLPHAVVRQVRTVRGKRQDLGG